LLIPVRNSWRRRFSLDGSLNRRPVYFYTGTTQLVIFRYWHQPVYFHMFIRWGNDFQRLVRSLSWLTTQLLGFLRRLTTRRHHIFLPRLIHTGCALDNPVRHTGGAICFIPVHPPAALICNPVRFRDTNNESIVAINGYRISQNCSRQPLSLIPLSPQ
jgi:hypothetical protein